MFKVTESMAPMIEAAMYVLDNRVSKYALDSSSRRVSCPNGTSALIAEVFECQSGKIVAVFVRYSYDPANRTAMIYG
jgi:hypothetical protein